jgi:hypothetical protein
MEPPRVQPPPAFQKPPHFFITKTYRLLLWWRLAGEKRISIIQP